MVGFRGVNTLATVHFKPVSELANFLKIYRLTFSSKYTPYCVWLYVGMTKAIYPVQPHAQITVLFLMLASSCGSSGSQSSLCALRARGTFSVIFPSWTGLFCFVLSLQGFLTSSIHSKVCVCTRILIPPRISRYFVPAGFQDLFLVILPEMVKSK